jgi:hypothetical protein
LIQDHGKIRNPDFPTDSGCASSPMSSLSVNARRTLESEDFHPPDDSRGDAMCESDSDVVDVVVDDESPDVLAQTSNLADAEPLVRPSDSGHSANNVDEVVVEIEVDSSSSEADPSSPEAIVDDAALSSVCDGRSGHGDPTESDSPLALPDDSDNESESSSDDPFGGNSQQDSDDFFTIRTAHVTMDVSDDDDCEDDGAAADDDDDGTADDGSAADIDLVDTDLGSQREENGSLVAQVASTVTCNVQQPKSVFERRSEDVIDSDSSDEGSVVIDDDFNEFDTVTVDTNGLGSPPLKLSNSSEPHFHHPSEPEEQLPEHPSESEEQLPEALESVQRIASLNQASTAVSVESTTSKRKLVAPLLGPQAPILLGGPLPKTSTIKTGRRLGRPPPLMKAVARHDTRTYNDAGVGFGAPLASPPPLRIPPPSRPSPPRQQTHRTVPRHADNAWPTHRAAAVTSVDTAWEIDDSRAVETQRSALPPPPSRIVVLEWPKQLKISIRLKAGRPQWFPSLTGYVHPKVTDVARHSSVNLVERVIFRDTTSAAARKRIFLRPTTALVTVMPEKDVLDRWNGMVHSVPLSADDSVMLYVFPFGLQLIKPPSMLAEMWKTMDNSDRSLKPDELHGIVW